MQFGRVYRRLDLERASTAVDRDLKTLLEEGEVRKLARGLYCRPKSASPETRELVRAFLKTDDFLLADGGLVYNRKRAGHFILDGRRFHLRVVRAYPKDRMALRVTSKEEERGDLEYWLAKSPSARVAAVEFLREQYYALSGFKSLPRLARAIVLRDRRA